METADNLFTKLPNLDVISSKQFKLIGADIEGDYFPIFFKLADKCYVNWKNIKGNDYVFDTSFEGNTLTEALKKAYDELINRNIVIDTLIPKDIKIESSTKQNKCNKMVEKVINLVRQYAEDYFNKRNLDMKFEVFVVWQCYILGNRKWLLATTASDGMYFEVTYNKSKDEFYIDVYRKYENKCISNHEIN